MKKLTKEEKEMLNKVYVPTKQQLVERIEYLARIYIQLPDPEPGEPLETALSKTIDKCNLSVDINTQILKIIVDIAL